MSHLDTDTGPDSDSYNRQTGRTEDTEGARKRTETWTGSWLNDAKGQCFDFCPHHDAEVSLVTPELIIHAFKPTHTVR